MSIKSLKTLEYDKIIKMLEDKAKFSLGKEMVRKLQPHTDVGKIKVEQEETGEAVSLIIQKGSLPLGGISDINKSLKRVSIDGVLSVEELIQVSDFLYVTNKVMNYSNNIDRKIRNERLEKIFSNIQVVEELEKEINNCIDGDKGVKDNASRELSFIRKSIKSTNDRIREKLGNVLNATANKDLLQESVVTIRNDRYCVPIKQEYRNKFKGMVHDQSSTGATVFIEPMQVVEYNNKIKELKLAEIKEIEKILRRLSCLVKENVVQLKNNLEVLTKLDFIFAKGELALEQNATKPILNENKYIYLKNARHPLLPEKEAVKNDIYLGDEFKTLLITGPNTGGKTVTLKTIGLAVLMAQSGLHVVASHNSEVGVFDNVFADIGDEQSIEQNLSTFSSHMTNIVNIIDNVTNDSLVLFDELGAGTDPLEGANLAIAIIEYLSGIDVTLCVTTHYSELKVFAVKTKGVENASCEFNIETLTPTYKLLMGVPGKSNAFEISKRLGLPDFIINNGRSKLNEKDIKFEDVITEIEMSKKAMMLEEEKMRKLKEEAKQIKEKYEEEQLKIEQNKIKIINEAKVESRRITKLAKSEADRLVKELKDKYNNKGTVKELDKVRQEIQSNLSKYNVGIENLNKPNKFNKEVPKEINIGDEVFITSLNTNGIALTKIGNNEEVLIQAGIIKMKMHISNLVLKNEKKKNKPKVQKRSKIGKANSISTELDIRGSLVLEGIELVDKYLDDAALSNINTITIIHGKGTGMLRKGVHSHLKNHPLVESFRKGEFGEGDDGVTIIQLK